MVQKLSVLVIEDEKSICDFIAKTLNASDYKAVTAGSGKEGLAILTSALPDLVLLDLGLPDMDGIDIIKQTREWSSLPIIVISARVQEREKVAALDAGADDYITKPFGTDELLARIRTAIRHSNKIVDDKVNSTRPYSARGLVVDFGKRLVTVERKEIHLTRVEYKIVSMLAQNVFVSDRTSLGALRRRQQQDITSQYGQYQTQDREESRRTRVYFYGAGHRIQDDRR